MTKPKEEVLRFEALTKEGGLASETQDESKNFVEFFAKLTDAQKYILSDVASNTPIVEQKKIQKFTLQ